jgi:hypothetical protein
MQPRRTPAFHSYLRTSDVSLLCENLFGILGIRELSRFGLDDGVLGNDPFPNWYRRQRAAVGPASFSLRSFPPTPDDVFLQERMMPNCGSRLNRIRQMQRLILSAKLDFPHSSERSLA